MTSIGSSAPPLRPNGTEPVVLKQYKDYTESTAVSFKTFAPRDPTTQAKYDAMSPTWEGVDPTNSALSRGEFRLDAVPSATYTPQAPPPEAPAEANWFCVVQ
jgi:hypothetical protein